MPRPKKALPPPPPGTLVLTKGAVQKAVLSQQTPSSLLASASQYVKTDVLQLALSHYVQVKRVQPSPPAPAITPKPATPQPEPAPAPPAVSAPPTEPPKFVRAICDSGAPQPGATQLVFKAGDLIHVLEWDVSDWSVGQLDQQYGYFSPQYVEVVDDLVFGELAKQTLTTPAEAPPDPGRAPAANDDATLLALLTQQTTEMEMARNAMLQAATPKVSAEEDPVEAPALGASGGYSPAPLVPVVRPDLCHYCSVSLEVKRSCTYCKNVGCQTCIKKFGQMHFQQWRIATPTVDPDGFSRCCPQCLPGLAHGQFSSEAPLARSLSDNYTTLLPTSPTAEPTPETKASGRPVPSRQASAPVQMQGAPQIIPSPQNPQIVPQHNSPQIIPQGAPQGGIVPKTETFPPKQARGPLPSPKIVDASSRPPIIAPKSSGSGSGFGADFHQRPPAAVPEASRPAIVPMADRGNQVVRPPPQPQPLNPTQRPPVPYPVQPSLATPAPVQANGVYKPLPDNITAEVISYPKTLPGYMSGDCWVVTDEVALKAMVFGLFVTVPGSPSPPAFFLLLRRPGGEPASPRLFVLQEGSLSRFRVQNVGALSASTDLVLEGKFQLGEIQGTGLNDRVLTANVSGKAWEFHPVPRVESHFSGFLLLLGITQPEPPPVAALLVPAIVPNSPTLAATKVPTLAPPPTTKDELKAYTYEELLEGCLKSGWLKQVDGVKSKDRFFLFKEGRLFTFKSVKGKPKSVLELSQVASIDEDRSRSWTLHIVMKYPSKPTILTAFNRVDYDDWLDLLRAQLFARPPIPKKPLPARPPVPDKALPPPPPGKR